MVVTLAGKVTSLTGPSSLVVLTVEEAERGQWWEMNDYIKVEEKTSYSVSGYPYQRGIWACIL